MNKYYIRVMDLITKYYKDKKDVYFEGRLGQYVLDNLGKELHSKMYPIVDNLGTDSFVYYETNNVIAARSLMDTAIAMGDDSADEQ